jgi:hypothetical protein
MITSKHAIILESLIACLPKLPTTLRYYDDYNDKYVSIKNPTELDIWPVMYTGRQEKFDFQCFENEIIPLIKCWLPYQFG